MKIKRSKQHVVEKKSLPLKENYAKIVVIENGDAQLGIDVETHCKIVGNVAHELFLRIQTPYTLHLFPKGFHLISALHDIGKINPYFQEKIRRIVPGYVANSIQSLVDVDPQKEHVYGYHSDVSSIALRGFSGPLIQFVVGSHHGFLPKDSHLLPSDEALGGSGWQEIRIELLDILADYFSTNIPQITSYEIASIVAGITTVADWIGSGPTFDSYSIIDDSSIPLLVKQAVDAAGFFPLKMKQNLSFSDMFGYENPNMIQQELHRLADTPGVYILEAQMGEGKTEAALYCAYKMLEKGMARGIYFALPTQITSEKIYGRIESFVHKILDNSTSNFSQMIHSSSWMFDMELGKEGDIGNSWFNSNKRKILAPFAVGTIDQALMAVMNVRHGFVRSFALAGKVVILDEVHTYDSYTGRILDYLIKNLVYWGCTVIILSATLSANRITTLTSLISYQKELEILSDNYPLITKINKNRPPSYSNPIITRETKFKIEMSSHEDYCIQEVRERALSGEYVLWIENVVTKAQDMYKEFASWGKEVGVEVGLLHSRYEPLTRKSLDDYWVHVLGKEGVGERKKAGKILIGTQVLEQSLDIDADFLVTKIAPIDMILQRLGRVWRHRLIDTYRPENAIRKIIVISPSLEEIKKNPLFVFGASGAIYAPYVLAKTVEVLSSLTTITLPTEIRSLINETYDEQWDENYLSFVKSQLVKERKNLENLATKGLILSGATHSDHSKTRYAEIMSVEVLLLKKEFSDSDTYIYFSDGEKVIIPKHKNLLRSEKKHIALHLMQHLIKVPSYMAPLPLPKSQLQFLNKFLYISSSEEERMRIAIVEDSGTIRGYNNSSVNDKYFLSYTQKLGFSAHKKEDHL